MREQEENVTERRVGKCARGQSADGECAASVPPRSLIESLIRRRSIRVRVQCRSCSLLPPWRHRDRPTAKQPSVRFRAAARQRRSVAVAVAERRAVASDGHCPSPLAAAALRESNAHTATTTLDTDNRRGRMMDGLEPAPCRAIVRGCAFSAIGGLRSRRLASAAGAVDIVWS